jgi:hypothetical protein
LAKIFQQLQLPKFAQFQSFDKPGHISLKKQLLIFLRGANRRINLPAILALPHQNNLKTTIC